MTVAYFDTSALVKLVMDEAGSDAAARLWNGVDEVYASRVAHPEVRAALAAARRGGRLDDAGLREARSDWDGLAETIRRIELTQSLETEAGDLAETHSLSGVDAVHLASALAVGAALPLVLATWDRRLAEAAEAVGLAILPA